MKKSTQSVPSMKYPRRANSWPSSDEWIDARPNREHEARIALVNLVDELFRIGVLGFIEAHGVPARCAPILPILHDHVERQVSPPKLIESLDDLV